MSNGRGRSVAMTVTIWIGVLLTGVGIWAVQVPLNAWWGSEPVVGGGASWPTVAQTPLPVLPRVDPASPSDPDALADAIGKIKVPEGVSPTLVVLDVDTGETVVRINGKPQASASTMKLLTSVVALDVLGPDLRFETSVVKGKSGQIVLVGGGDPLLATKESDAAGGASLEALADSTADALKSQGSRTVELVYDDSLFTGPAWHSEWPDSFRWSVAPITALKADQARLSRPTPGNAIIDRAPDPSARAARSFGSLLKSRGIKVNKVAPGKAPGGAEKIATVESAPVATIVETLMLTSDNDATEALARQIALAEGKPGSFTGSRKAVAAGLDRLGLMTKGMDIRDTSGISAENRVSPLSLARAVRLGITDAKQRPALAGMPVAGVSGTLRERFDPDKAAPGRGLVRAKTGTIPLVNALAGYAVNSDGNAFTFGIMTYGGNPAAAREWLDAVSSELAR